MDEKIIPALVPLLKTPSSDEFWAYTHTNNPIRDPHHCVTHEDNSILISDSVMNDNNDGVNMPACVLVIDTICELALMLDYDTGYYITELVTPTLVELFDGVCVEYSLYMQAIVNTSDEDSFEDYVNISMGLSRCASNVIYIR